MIRPAFALLPLLLAASAPGQDGPAPTHWSVYVGTYTGGPSASEGIYRFDLDLGTGALTPKGVVAKTISPAFLALHPTKRFLYAVNEVSRFDGKPEGGVSSFAIDPKDGSLRAINHQTTGGAGPCHLAVDPTGKTLVVANYGSGSVASFRLGDTGSIDAIATRVEHQGSGPNKSRQEGPHAHSVDFDASGQLILVNDLGTDQTLTYRLGEGSTLSLAGKTASAPGAGPRHLAFHPTDPVVYVINELTSTVTTHRYEPVRGALTPLQTVSTLPPAGVPGSTTAEVAVHPSGRFVYGSNRGADSLAIFAVEKATGKLTPVGFQPTGGRTPRHFAIDPTGAYLLAANQGTDDIVVFRVDGEKGTLTPTGASVRVPVPVPVCVLFAPAPAP